jgi:hypothetical protein
MVPTGDNNLIYHRADYGPTFGNGHDIHICNGCNTNGSSYANFPTHYNIEGPNKYTRDQNSYKAFSGAMINYHFKVTEYEVFQVIFN